MRNRADKMLGLRVALRRPNRWHGAILSVVLLVFFVAPAFSAWRATGGGQKHSGFTPFSHKNHVPDAWWELNPENKPTGEVAQDCRGCHQIGAEGRAQVGVLRKDQCNDCHVAGFMEYQGELKVRKQMDGGQSFRHGEHGSMDCSKCHHPSLDPDVAGGSFALLVPKVTESGYCGSCHSSNSSGFGGTSGKEMAELLNAGLSRRSLGGGDFFSHGTHVPGFVEGQGLDSDSCKKCHTVSGGSDGKGPWQMGLDTSNCATKCHTGVEFKLELASRQSALRGTFLHSDHPTVGLGSVSCENCHRPDPGGSGKFQTPLVGAEGAGQYQGLCADCHGEKSNAGDSHGPLVKSHRTEDFEGCQSCHAVDSGTDTAWQEFSKPTTGRETRGDLRSSFALAPGSHKEWENAKVCTDCHRSGGLDALRVTGNQRFSHATHLTSGQMPVELKVPGDAAIEACTDCHGPASSGSNVLWVQGDSDVAVQMDACSTCHLGGMPEDRSGWSDEPLGPAGDFLHADHTGVTLSGSQELNCLDCHALKSDDGSMRLVEDVGNCKACHGHGAESVVTKSTQGLAVGDVQNCKSCHGGGYPSAVNNTVFSTVGVIANVKVKTHNPGNLACTDCHITWDSSEVPGNARVGFRKGRTSGISSRHARITTKRAGLKVFDSPHAQVHRELRKLRNASAAYMDEAGDESDPYFGSPKFNEHYSAQGTHCFYCHWSQPDRPYGASQSGRLDVLRTTLRSKETFESKLGEVGPWKAGLPGLEALLRKR